MPLVVNTPAGLAEVLELRRDIVAEPRLKLPTTYRPGSAMTKVRILSDNSEIEIPTSMCSDAMLIDDLAKPLHETLRTNFQQTQKE